MEIFNSISHAMERGRECIFQAIFSLTTNVIDTKLGSHNVDLVRNILGMS